MRRFFHWVAYHLVATYDVKSHAYLCVYVCWVEDKSRMVGGGFMGARSEGLATYNFFNKLERHMDEARNTCTFTTNSELS